MKRFVKSFSVLFCAVIFFSILLILFDCLVISSQYKNNYQASLIDKVERLNSIKEPKIILVGNSNLSFGINSAMIEEELGVPVVNLGLHGGLGNAFHEEIAKLNINKDDIVVVCHSNFEDDDDIPDPSLAWITFDWNKSLASIIRTKDYLQMIPAYPNYFRDSFSLWLSKKGNQSVDTCYSRKAFNKYGDIVYRPEKQQMTSDELFASQLVTVPKINSTCIDRLNMLNDFCTQRGATLLVAGYPIAYGHYSDFSANDFINFQNELSNKLNCPIISNYTDYFYPYDYFYNTILHLTEEGANMRTRQLINDMKTWEGT